MERRGVLGGHASIAVNEHSTTFIKDWLPGSGSEKVVASALIEAVKSKHAAGKC